MTEAPFALPIESTYFKGESIMKKDGYNLKFYGSNWIALFPFLVFIGSLLIFATNRMKSSQPALMGLTLLSIALLSFMAKDSTVFWKTLVKGMTKPSVAMFTLIFTLVGVFATLLNAGGIAGGIIWLASVAHIKGAMFIGFTFIAAAILSTGSGSSMATVLTLGPALYPAGVILGANPFVLAGALISGANFGDTLAPVSDVTIAATGNQFFRKTDRPAEIGGTVKARFKYAVVAGLLSLVILMILGSSGGNYLGAEEANALIQSYSNAMGLVMLIPVAVIIYFSVSGKHIGTSLMAGIVTAIIISVATGLIEPSQLIGVDEKMKLIGIIPTGVVKMVNLIIIMSLLMGAGHIMLISGVMHEVVEKLSKIAKTPRSTEIVSVFLSSVMGMLGGFAVMGIAVAGPFVDALGKEQKLHPYRRANILSTCTTSICHAVPWSSQLFVLAGFLVSMKDTYTFIPDIATTDFFMYCVHPWVLPLVMLVAAYTGWGRIYEGDGEEIIKGNYKNEIPKSIAS